MLSPQRQFDTYGRVFFYEAGVANGTRVRMRRMSISVFAYLVAALIIIGCEGLGST
jgi:hypothetical protein